MAKRELDCEKSITLYDSGENARASFKSKFKSRFNKNDRQNLFIRLEKIERKGKSNVTLCLGGVKERRR